MSFFFSFNLLFLKVICDNPDSLCMCMPLMTLEERLAKHILHHAVLSLYAIALMISIYRWENLFILLKIVKSFNYYFLDSVWVPRNYSEICIWIVIANALLNIFSNKFDHFYFQNTSPNAKSFGNYKFLIWEPDRIVNTKSFDEYLYCSCCGSSNIYTR